MRRLLIGAMLAAMAATGALAAPPGKPAPYRPAHNAHGQPDFEGTWSFNSSTRLVRPAGVANLRLTEEEARKSAPGILPKDAVGTDETEGYDSFGLGWARLGDEIRSSWIVDPADGKLPFNAAGQALMQQRGNNDNPEGRSVYERCLYTPQGGPPMLNAAYNNHLSFLQTREAIAIQLEANHEVRIVRLTGRDHERAPRWFGDSVGWFEGETLVVETVGFTPSQSDRRSVMTPLYMSPKAKVTERFTRISARQIKYEFTVEDPVLFSQVWRGEVPLTLTTEPTFEYACHEGNYGLANILAGAREEEKRAGR